MAGKAALSAYDQSQVIHGSSSIGRNGASQVPAKDLLLVLGMLMNSLVVEVVNVAASVEAKGVGHREAKVGHATCVGACVGGWVHVWVGGCMCG